MTRRLLRAGMLAAVTMALAPQFVLAQPGTVEEIYPQGIRRMSPDSFLEALGVRKGDPYDRTSIIAGFRRLWDLGIFSDIVIEAEDGPGGGKVLIIKVKERPILSSVSYEDNKVLNRTQIEDRFQERETPLELGRPLDQKRVYEAEATIRDYLAEKGYLEAKVSHEIRPVTATSNSVHFHIRPGSKTRIRKIRFQGNEIFSGRRLKKELQLTKPRKWYWPWSGKSLYHPIKWDQDAGGIRDLYQSMGYLDVEIRPPVVEVVESEKKEKNKEKKRKKKKDEVSPKKIKKVVKAQKKLERSEEKRRALGETSPPEGLTPRKMEKWEKGHQRKLLKAEGNVEKASDNLKKAQTKTDPSSKRWVNLTVPIVEGVQYVTGEIEIEGNTVFSDIQIRSLLPLREGTVLSNTLLKAGIDRIGRLYGDRGHLYANVVRQIRRHEDEPVADVRVNIEEDDPYQVDTIEFSGNNKTHDRVLRREIRLNESDLFSRTRLDVSVRKINQLGYFEVRGDPIIEPLEGQNRVRISILGEEKGRNEVQVGGGFSGLDGAFFTGFYSTRNFLGRGQILSTSLQIGGRANRYSVSFVEPWFLSRPITLGFSLFRRDVNFGGDLRSSGKGGGLVLGRQLGVFSSIRLNYNFESITSTGFTLTGGEATNRISSITPIFQTNRINDPFRPSRGWSMEGQTQVAGDFLGGDTAFIKPIVSYTSYWNALRRSFLAFHAQAGLVRTFGDGTTANTATVAGVPRFQRFWLGGDNQGPRVFDIRAVTPVRFVKLDALGNIEEAIKDPRGRLISDFDRNADGILDSRDLIELGGDRFFLFQTELVYPVNEQFDLAVFLDVGNSLFEDTSFGFNDARVSAGVELRFYLPVFPVPLRLIYGFPLRESAGDRSSNFTFSIGRSF